MKETEHKVLAMYDVRGIQNYIYRTDKVQDAIGASYIVENIILEALENSVEREKDVNSYQTKWYDKEGPLNFAEKNMDVQVLFIGGGNAYVLFRNKDLCIQINQKMSKYVLEHTYSLQLAVAICEKSQCYTDDYKDLQSKMRMNKANMVLSKPFGAIPVMKVELKTGYPATMIDSRSKKEMGEETRLKQEAYRNKRKAKGNSFERDEQIFDNLVTQKGVDSRLAVVHIDGNSMGVRIRQIVEGIEDYTEAVNKMREISFQIMNSYQETFQNMHDHFTDRQSGQEGIPNKEGKYVVREILVAGDDVTYVCNARIALESVKYFSRDIAKKAMVRENSAKSLKKYGFSVCAGVAFIGSHFPFRIGYDVAEQCCASAKKRAKSKECKDTIKFLSETGKYVEMDRIGNFVDFQICKNIQSANFEEMRKREYVTRSGEQLMIRPFFICSGRSAEEEPLEEKNNKEIYSYEKFEKGLQYFMQGADTFPRRFALQLRNTYPLGENQVELLNSFLQSRGFSMPDGEKQLYYKEDKKSIAKWYDVLEMLDYCMAPTEEETEGGDAI